MHLLRTQTLSLDEAAPAVDLGQTRGGHRVPVLHRQRSRPRSPRRGSASAPALPSLRLASLAQLKHPYSVDLYRRAASPLARASSSSGCSAAWTTGATASRNSPPPPARAASHLAVVPGDYQDDPRLDAASTLPVEDLRRLWRWFRRGRPRQCRRVPRLDRRRGSGATPAWREPEPVPAMADFRRRPPRGAEDAPRALIVFYRSVLMAADTAPIDALADAWRRAALPSRPCLVTSLKDPAAAEGACGAIATGVPTSSSTPPLFRGRAGERPGRARLRRRARCSRSCSPSSTRGGLARHRRGLAAADLAMNVVLPETDGRIVTRAISFKAESERSDALEFTRLVHRPRAVARRLMSPISRRPGSLCGASRAPQRRIACVLSDYPAKGGRTGYAVGLDTPASVAAIAADLPMRATTSAACRRPAHLIARSGGRPSLLEPGRHTIPDAVRDLAAGRSAKR